MKGGEKGNLLGIYHGPQVKIKMCSPWEFPVAQRLRLWDSTAGNLGLILGGGARIPQAELNSELCFAIVVAFQNAVLCNRSLGTILGIGHGKSRFFQFTFHG